MGVRAECRATVRDCLLAKDRDFQKAEAVCLAAAVYWGVREPRDAHRVRPQAALQKVAYSREPRQPGEPVRLRVV